MRDDNVSCPYCNAKLIKLPKRKTRCISCGEFIYIRTGEPVTKNEAMKIDWLKRIESHGITENDYEKLKRTLSKRFGKEANPRDVIWGLFNNMIIDNANNFHELKIIYFEMGLFLDEEGKDSYNVRYQSSKMELLGWKEFGTKKVRIVSTGGCLSCKKLEGKTFTLEEALKKMPLPNKNCTFHLNNNKYSWCRCIYLPE